jgi:hypothetical protein
VKKIILRSRVSSKDFAEKLLKLLQDSGDSLNSPLARKLNHSITDVLEDRLKSIRDSLSPTVFQKKAQYKSLDDDTRYMIEIQVDIIARVLNLIKNAPQTASTSQSPVMTMSRPLLDDLLNRVQQLLLTLFKRDRFTPMEYERFIAEVNRLDFIRAFFLFKSATVIKSHSVIVEGNRKLEELLTLNVKPLREWENDSIKEVLEKMGKISNAPVPVTDFERQEIVKAIGLSQGHWYKCPNGHIYAVGECGSARQAGKCVECGAHIGQGSRSSRAF